MSDGSLRELERRWQESGAVADEARYLQALVREGALEPGRLATAALCGHPAAALARASADLEPADVLAWVQRVWEAEPRAAQRAAQTALEWAAQGWAPTSGGLPDRRVANVVARVGAWLEAPDAERAAAVRGVALAKSPPGNPPTVAWRLTEAARRLAQVVERPDELTPVLGCMKALLGLLRGRGAERGPPAEAALLQAARARLLAWALGAPPPSLTPAGFRLEEEEEDESEPLLMARSVTRRVVDRRTGALVASFSCYEESWPNDTTSGTVHVLLAPDGSAAWGFDDQGGVSAVRLPK